MPAFDDLLKQILSGNPNTGRDEILTMVEWKKEDPHGILTDEGAIRLLAQQLSASPPASSDLKDQRISSIHAGLNDSTITGEVISVSDVHEFQRSDRTAGEVLRMSVGETFSQNAGELCGLLAETVAHAALKTRSLARL